MKKIIGILFLCFLFNFLFGDEAIQKKRKDIFNPKVEKTLEDTTPKIISMFFVGDMMGHEPMINAAYNFQKREYSYSHWFQYIKEFVSQHDISCANLEVTLAGPPYSGYPQFSSPDAYAMGLKDAGFNLLVTANNHSQDRGKKGLERTIDVLDSIQMTHTGTFKNSIDRKNTYPLIQEIKGVKIAFLNYTYGTNGLEVQKPNIVNLIDTSLIKIDYESAISKGAQYVIVDLHWGLEYQRNENASQKKLAQWLANLGVDAIIGMHPHVVQPIEIIHPTHQPEKNIPVAYSLGNFISNQRDRYKDGGIGVQLKLKITNHGVGYESFGYIPFWCRRNGSPYGYYSIPVSDWERNPEKYQLSIEEKIKITTFIKDTRELLSNSKEVFLN